MRRAAELQGRSVSDFMVAAYDAARRTITDAQLVSLSLADPRAVAAAILDPPRPGPALQRAARSYRALIAAAA